MLRHGSSRARWALILALAPLGLLGACKKGGGASHLALIPANVTVVGGASPARIQESELYKKLAAAHVQALKPKADGEMPGVFDYLQGLQTITFGVGAPTGKDAPFVVILQGPSDPNALVNSLVAARAAKGKTPLAPVDHKGVKLYTKPGDPFCVAVLDGKVLGGSIEMVKQAIDLSKGAGQSVETNAALMALVAKTQTSHGLWAAGTVPPAMQNVGGKVKVLSASGSLDFANGVDLDVSMTTPAAADAEKSVADGTKQLAELKGNPMVAAMGMATYLDGIKLAASGADARVTVKLTAQQVNELIGRVEPMIKQGLAGLMGGGLARKRVPAGPPPGAAVAPSLPATGVSPVRPVAPPPGAPAPAVRPAAPAAPAGKPAAPAGGGNWAPR
jgi:hypothetical protein